MILQSSIKIAASHGGSFRIKLCPFRNATQECFDKNVLELINPIRIVPPGGDDRFGPNDNRTFYELIDDFTINVPQFATGGWRSWVNFRARLPNGLTCDHCVIQWHWNSFLYVDSNGNQFYPDKYENGSLVTP